MVTLRRTFFLALTAWACATAPALLHASADNTDHLPEPEGAVVLTVTGNIAVTNAGDSAQFDRDMLRALEVIDMPTTTIWTEGVQEFRGVRLAALMERLGVTGGNIEARAINDYAVEIPLDGDTSEAALIAFEIDGTPISRRQKGPLWIVYPFDSDARFRSELVYARSIWQLDRIHVQP